MKTLEMTKRNTIPHDAVEALKQIESLNKKMRELREQREDARKSGDKQTVVSLFEQERDIFIEQLVPLRREYHRLKKSSVGRSMDACSLPAAFVPLYYDGTC